MPAEGVGLNPLLRHPAMAIHPPMLYSGYVLFSIPFAFAIGALVARRLDASWIRSTRRFGLLAWIFLTCGILLGAGWSYMELGWGGYWGWDPVENASLMPWLVGTAFLHSIMVQERRGMLKVWNVSLICATFALCLLGTFLVRSGILESIHAFGASTVGTPLLGLIAVVLVGSTVLIVSRQRELRAERRVESLASREAVFLVNNLLLVGLCLIVFWGTFFPLISEAITGERSSLGAPWFDRYVTPLALGARPVHRNRAAARLAPAQRRPGAEAVRPADRVRGRGDGRARAVHRRGRRAARRWSCSRSPRSPLAGLAGRVRARRLGAAGARRGLLAGGARSPGLAQPAPLRRLHRPHRGRDRVRRRRRLVELPDQPRRADAAGRHDAGRRLHRHLRAGVHHRRRGRGAAHVRRRPARSTATASRSVLTPSRNYYSGRSAGTLASFFEGEATSEVGRSGGAAEDLWTAMRPDLTSVDDFIAGADRRIDRLTLPDDGEMPDPTTPGGVEQMRQIAEAARPAPGARRAEPPKPLRERRAAGRLPHQREPAGDLDLDRRRDRA